MSIVWSQNNIYKYAAIWVVIFLYILYFQSYRPLLSEQVIYSFIFTAEIAIVYYLMFYGLFPYFFKEKYFSFIFIYLLMFGLLWFFDILLFKLAYPYLGISTQRDAMSTSQFLNRTLFWFLIISVFVYGNIILKGSIIRTKLLRQRSFDSLNIELNSLKQQFHSHLTFNFLNQCYMELSETSDSASELVESYVSMLDYSLLYSNKNTILLEDEIDYISNFLSLQKKLSANVYYQFKTDILDRQKIQVIPMIFAVPIEVIFRLCKMNDSSNPIKIEISGIDKNIFFSLTGLKESKKDLVLQDELIFNTLEIIRASYDKSKIIEHESEYEVNLHVIIPYAG
jgi:hypothetical protein